MRSVRGIDHHLCAPLPLGHDPNIARKGEDDDERWTAGVTEAQARQIGEAIAKHGQDLTRFWRFMSMGLVKLITDPADVLARDSSEPRRSSGCKRGAE
jgi:hypothetical protein